MSTLFKIFFSIYLLTHSICSTFAQAKFNGKDGLVIDLFHKFSLDGHFEPRGSLQVRSNNRINWLEKLDTVTENQLNQLEQADGLYFVKASTRDTNKTSETFVRSCSLLSSDLNHLLVVNLSPIQDFINLNIISKDPDCLKSVPTNSLTDLKPELKLDLGTLGPVPDTTSFIKRQEEERKSKLREAKEDNRSFLLKYWMYILPGVILLMLVSGGQEPERR